LNRGDSEKTREKRTMGKKKNQPEKSWMVPEEEKKLRGTAQRGNQRAKTLPGGEKGGKVV